MMITLVVEIVDEDLLDPEHDTGITAATYDALVEALSSVGAALQEVRQ